MSWKNAKISTLGFRTRLAILLALVLTGSLILYSYLSYWYITSTHRAEFDAALYNYVIDVAHNMERSAFLEDGTVDSWMDSTEKILPFSLGQTFLQVVNANGKVTARSSNLGDALLPWNAEDFKQLLQHKTILRNIHWSDGRIYRLVTHWISQSDLGEFVLLVAVPAYPLEREQQGLLTFFGLSIPLALFIAAITGYFFAAHALRPVGEIIASANKIEATNLSLRLAEPSTTDELGALVRTLNGLLSRLESSFASQEHFIAEASHQLKTPLAILLGELEEANRSGEPQAWKNFFLSARSELLHLSKTVENLLSMARIDSDKARVLDTSLRVDERILEILNFLNPVAKRKQVVFKVSLKEETHPPQKPFEILSDPALLRCLFENLLENAVKYTATHSTIDIEMADLPDRVEVRIRDQGPGIQPQELGRISERFYRGSISRTDEITASTGLGLAIAKKIAYLHQGVLQLTNAPNQGLLATVVLPKGILPKPA